MGLIPSVGPLDRMLRFDGLAINAGAIPLPIDLGPSLLPHDPIDPSSADADASRAAHAPAPPIAVDDHAPHAVDPAPQDAVAKSLQAAIDAVHHSLADAGAAPASPHIDGVVVAAEQMTAPADHAPASVDHGAVDSAAHAADVATPDLMPATAPDPAGQAVSDTPVVATVDEALAPLDGLDATLARVVGDTVHEMAQDVNQDANHAAASIVQAADTVTDTLDGGSQPNATAEPPLLASSGTGAVVAPSLAGLGTDALAGLLHPATPAAPDPIHSTDSAAAAPHDMATSMATFTAIGLPEVMHADQDQAHQDVAHAASPAAHLVGSGLI